MRIYCIRHVAFEGPGIIENWAESHDFQVIKPYEGELFPDVSEVDALVIMGGPMGVNDAEEYPWLTNEMQLIRASIDEGLPVLGICLGAQLLASVLGSQVYRNESKEIGWFPIHLTDEGRQHPFTLHLVEQFTTFHWHGDTYELPEGAVHLAYSAACQQQAFAYKNALGLQFHMEMTEEGIAEVSERCSHEFKDSRFIQTREQLIGQPAMKLNHESLANLLDIWVQS